jgi:PA14 domain
MAQAVKIAAAVWLAAAVSGAQDAPTATFGVTVVDTTGLEGKIYLLKSDTRKLPNFRKMKPKGSIYTTTLNIPPRHFTEGFPGVTDRFEWFAIDYSGRFWIDHPGIYRFSLLSDDGSKLYIDDRLVIDNDGVHWAKPVAASTDLAEGAHSIRVCYFQGPRDEVALVLSVARPGEGFRIFSTRDFRPSNPEEGKRP